jgi:hypothetical protein
MLSDPASLKSRALPWQFLQYSRDMDHVTLHVTEGRPQIGT